MKIEKNWFYKLSEIFTKIKETNILKISDNLFVSIFDDLNINIKIYIWKKTKLEFYWLSKKWQNCNIIFIQNDIFSDIVVKYLLLSNFDNKKNLKIYSEIWANNIKSNIFILSVIWNNWFIDLDWIIKINKNLKNIIANLNEENIFLWKNWKIKWVPTLFVNSNDVKASHSCKVEKINDEKLFYLRSRWISKEESINKILESYISNLFSCIEMYDNKFYNKLYKNIIYKLNNISKSHI